MKEFAIKINGNQAKNLNEFYDQISKTLLLPDYFSKNLDSLSECLNDLSWIESESIKVIIENSSSFLTENSKDKEKVINLMNDVYSEWANVPNFEGEEKFRKKRIFQFILQ